MGHLVVRRFVVVIGIILLSSSLACNSSAPASSESTEPASAPLEPVSSSATASIKEKGKLVVLTVPHQENPFAKTNLARGPMKPTGTRDDFLGIDVDLMAAFAEHLGVDLEIRPAVGPDGIPSYDYLIPMLQKGDGDVIASSFTITEERDEIIDFSPPYFTVYPAVISRADSHFSSRDDLKGKIPSILPGTSQEAHLIEAGFKKSEIHFVDFHLDTYGSVLEGQADFTLQDSPTAIEIVRDYPELILAFPFNDRQDYFGFGVADGSDLRSALEEFLVALKNNGKLEELTKL